MRIRILSDIHLECARNGMKAIIKLIPSHKTNDILILAGDIGYPTSKLYPKFIQTIAPYYSHVIIVAGNHEYYQRKFKNGSIKSYGLSINDIDITIKNIAENLPNVHFLQKDELIIDNIRFLGCTLWTSPDPLLTYLMNDYTCINDLDFRTVQSLHDDHTSWLTQKLSEAHACSSTIVITHHAPSSQLLEQHAITSCFYYDNLESMMDKVDYWVCGHVHGFKDIHIQSCRCIKNAVGYPVQNLGCNSFYTIEI